jgi:hypothetical protein
LRMQPAGQYLSLTAPGGGEGQACARRRQRAPVPGRTNVSRISSALAPALA